MSKFVPRVFSGMQPTGNLHLGNYLGAMLNWIHMQDTHECIYCVVDMHAITVWQEPKDLRKAIVDVTAAYLACGLDPKKSVIFNQSQVAEHAELAWILGCVARLGWLNRMTQFKEKAGKDKEAASIGLYTYPVLMAADILGYHATHVPVGEDQKQHLELARDIANKFNLDYADAIRDAGIEDGQFFVAPEPYITGPATRVMSLARRHQEDVEVGPLGPVAPQPHGRCRHHRQEDPQGQDRCRAAAVREGGPQGPPRGRQSRRHLCGLVGRDGRSGAGAIWRRAVLGVQERAGRSGRGQAWSHRRRNQTAAGGPSLCRRRC